MSGSRHLLAWASVVIALAACSGSTASPSETAQTGEGGVDAGGDAALAVDSSSGGTTTSDASDAAADATVIDDAGLPCPRAVINHPGTEPRPVGAAIPFVGLARDSTCAAITGTSLVWTDDREGQIGTGEMFSHKFTKTGPHTVTLTATDGQGKTSTATVTFTLS